LSIDEIQDFNRDTREVLDDVICTYLLGEWDLFPLANLDILLLGGGWMERGLASSFRPERWE